MNKYRQIDLFTLELGNALCQEASLKKIFDDNYRNTRRNL